MFVVLCAMMGAAGYGDAPAVERVNRILDASAAQRARLESGVITVRQDLSSPEGEAFLVSEVSFSAEMARFDILDGTVYRSLEKELGKLPKVKESVVLDGEKALRKTHLPAAFPHTIEEPGNLFFFHPAVLGLPGAPDSMSDVGRALRRDWKAMHVTEVSGVGRVSIDLVPVESSSELVQVLNITLDSGKDWSVVEYVLESQYDSGNHYVSTASVEYEAVGDIWFPRSVVREQTRNGELQFTLRCQVLKADWTQPVEPKHFTWEGLGIKPGDYVMSHVAEVASGPWNPAPPRAAPSWTITK
ncbi:MAG: hypothetical protein BroJett003_24570 [Planctomycetota bacterium]|nr:MAG: hypothetical protein BroJett003_24570 [Planctomycetota bacterium]